MIGTNEAGGRQLTGAMLLDESLSVLRAAPIHILFSYCIGALPFTVGLVYFVSDMSRSAYAAQRCAAESLLLALLFVWMKTWQSVFATQIHGWLSGVDNDGRPSQVFRAASTQAIIQTTAIPVLLAASALLVPFAWCYLFYQNALLYANGGHNSFADAVRESWRHARANPFQGNAFLGLGSLLSMFVFANVFAALCTAPMLLKRFAGIETVFSRSPMLMLNTTVLTVATCMTFLIVDPIMKTGCIIRCFLHAGRATGQDLRLTLRQLKAARISRVALLLGTAVLAATTVQAQNASVPPERLAREIGRTLDDPLYAWRMPRELSTEALDKLGPAGRFCRSVVTAISETAQGAMSYFSDLFGRLGRLLSKRGDKTARTPSSAWAWLANARLWILLLTAMVVAVCAWQLWHVWRTKRTTTLEAQVNESIPAIPDITDERVTAADLPSDDWLALARSLMAEGKARLALRAAHLASLAFLADRGFVVIAKYKSSSEYAGELGRRGHQLPELAAAFGANVRDFERTWYGNHHAGPDVMDRALSNFEAIRRLCARP